MDKDDIPVFIDDEKVTSATTTAQKLFEVLEKEAEGVVISGSIQAMVIVHFSDHSAIQLDYNGYRTGTLVYPSKVN